MWTTFLRCKSAAHRCPSLRRRPPTCSRRRLKYERLEERALLSANWLTAPSVPFPVGSPAIATGRDGRVYEFGGTTDGQTPTVSAEAFNPATNTWNAIAN